MTHQHFSTCSCPETLVNLVPTTKRKLRLFAVACCKQKWDTYSHPTSHQAIVAAEQFADGLISGKELNQAYDKAYDYWQLTLRDAAPVWVSALNGREHTDRVHFRVGLDVSVRRAIRAAAWTGENSNFKEEGLKQCDIFRDIVNPYYFYSTPDEVAALIRWHDGVLAKMAEDIYYNNKFDTLPIFADALQEAGCTDREILDHCRNGKIHVKGCWVIDLFMGKL